MVHSVPGGDLNIMVQELENLLGTPPIGFEWLSYVFAGMLVVLGLRALVGVVTALFGGVSRV